MTLAQRFIGKITSRYTQNPDSNIGRIIKVITDEMQELTDTNMMIVEYQDIDKTVGRPLDRYGWDVGQPRAGMDDESYRFMIKTKDRANFSNGDIETINEMMDNLLGDSYLGLRETWAGYSNEPAAIVLLYDTDVFIPQLLFDGSARFDGEYLFSGNREGEFATAALDNIKVAIRRVVKRGIKVYFGIPLSGNYQFDTRYASLVRIDLSTTYRQFAAYNQATAVKQVGSITKALTFDGSAFFNGVHTFDGRRDPVSYGGTVKVNEVNE